MNRRTLLPLGLALTVACGAEPLADAGFSSLEDRATFDRAADRHVTHNSLLRVADGFFDFDPTLDPTKTAEENAAAVAARATEQLAGCGTVMRSVTAVSVDFGPPPGCALNGVEASGSVALTVAKTDVTLTVELTFASFTIDGRSADGTARFVTTNGSSFTVEIDLGTSGGSADLTVVGAPGAFTIDGTASVTDQSGQPVELGFTAVHYTRGDCYPDGGIALVTKRGSTMTVTFDARTADTGVVTVTQGRRSFEASLPAYGSCPGGSSPDAGVARPDATSAPDASGLRRDAR